MISPRWRKVMRDLWGNRARTFLVVLAIAVGAAALGMVAGTYVTIVRDLPAGYLASNPASFRIYTEPFGDDLVRAMRSVPGVEAVEGKRALGARVRAGTGDEAEPPQWLDIELSAVSDYGNIRIDRIAPEAGEWPPMGRGLWVERAALDLIGARSGDVLLVRTSDDQERELRVAGTVHDVTVPSARFANQAYGYVTLDALEWFGIPRNFNELLVVVDGDKTDRDHIAAVAAQVRDKVEKGGRTVFWTVIPEPGKHPFERFVTPMALLLSVLGLLALLLSAFLVINTIAALLAQQIRQIGVMKAIGARTGQITGLYLGMVSLLGLAAFAIAVPLGWLAARGVTAFVARLVNFDITSFHVPPWVYVLQGAASLLVPLTAALVPIRAGTRITVREAIASYGLSPGKFGGGIVDRLLVAMHGLSRPLMLSLRNTFRRKARLALTLLALGLGSTIFVAVFAVRASLVLTLDDALKYWQYDVGIVFNRPYRVDEIERLALGVPGVARAESWGYQGVRRRRPDGSYSDNLVMVAPPANTTLLQPEILRGRWLLPEDENALVINTDLLRAEEDVRVGQEMVLVLDGRETTWRVVGLIRGVLAGPVVYAAYPYYARVARNVDKAGSVQVVMETHAPADQEQVARALEQQYERSGLRVSSTQTIAQLRQITMNQFNVLLVFLLTMAVLLAVVGALGLMGTMSINVLERTREIGVMRAIGATGRAVRGIVVTEGAAIGLLSWVLGTALALPVSRGLSAAVGYAFLSAPLSYTFSPAGAAFWLGAVVVLASLASLLPARNASRLSVREVLAYE